MRRARVRRRCGMRIWQRQNERLSENLKRSPELSDGFNRSASIHEQPCRQSQSAPHAPMLGCCPSLQLRRRQSCPSLPVDAGCKRALWQRAQCWLRAQPQCAMSESDEHATRVHGRGCSGALAWQCTVDRKTNPLLPLGSPRRIHSLLRAHTHITCSPLAPVCPLTMSKGVIDVAVKFCGS